jgi:hypothetical protein
MKSKSLNLVLLSLLIFCSLQCYCQTFPKDFEYKKFVVEGQVVHQKFRYSNPAKGLIETLNFIKVKKHLKGSRATDTIIFLTEGGIMNGILESSSHSPKLEIGQIGLFAINEFELEKNMLISKFDYDNNNFIDYNTHH